jgi:class 3 adenylate cyclase
MKAMRPRQERKLVTVLFADLAGSTELAVRHDPEQLRALLSAFFEEMAQHVHAYGGTVEKYAGDAIMAVFGVPATHEDDAERAVRAAFAMRQGLAQLNPVFEQEYGVHLALRVGIATGEAVAASDEASEFLVTGEVANLAARLQAEVGGIVVSQDTHRLVGPLVESEQLPPLVLKGFPQPVTAYRVTGLSAGGVPRGVAGVSSPVVGRDPELGRLRQCVEELRRGRGQVVSIVGEAGLGKSRLKIEVIRAAEEGLPTSWEIGEWSAILFPSAWLGIAYTKLGRLDEARRVVGRALREGQARAVTPYFFTYLHIALAQLHLAAGEPEDALAVAQKARELAERSGFRLEIGAAHRVLGEAHAHLGHTGEADRAFQDSVAILEEIQSRPELGQTLLAYGRFRARTDPTGGRFLVERALRLFEQMGATGWAEEARAALVG